jgi:peptide/nickel transport system permease protein
MAWFIKRAALHTGLLFAVFCASFLLFHVVPTDPARSLLGPQVSEEQVNQLRKSLGLDQSLFTQATQYTKAAINLDFGRSFTDGRLVSAELVKKLPTTLALILMAGLLSLCYAFVSLFMLARGHGYFLSLFNFSISTLPTLFVAVLIALISLRFYPYTSYAANLGDFENWMALLPPALVLALFPMATLSRIVQSNTSDLLSSQFILAARARGLSETRIYFKHVLRNLFLPIVAVFSNVLPQLFTAAFIVEIVFSLPGIGSLLVKSILQQDFPMLEGIVLANAIVVTVAYIISDALYPLIDPRIKAGHE